jgi:colicin import membrane protein
VTARGRWWKSAAEIKPLTEDRKVLVQRYMIDADEALARRQVAEEADRRAAEELARRQAAEEADRRAAAELAQREAAEMPAALAAAVERARLQARAQEHAGREPVPVRRDGLERERAATGGLPIHGWARAAAQSRDRHSNPDWPRELVRLREEAQRGQ